MPIRGATVPPYAAGTVVTSSYLPWVRVTANSFAAHNPEATFYVLFTDGVPTDQLRPDDRFTALAVADVGLGSEQFALVRTIYNDLELCCALKPLLIRTMLVNARAALYLDADMRVYSSLAEAAERAHDTGLLLSPHALSPRTVEGVEDEEVLLRMGQFNAGFLAVGQAGRPFLDWWWSKLARECFDIRRAVPEHFLDQRWLDVAVGYFPLVIDRDVTTNVARWNLFQRELTSDDGRFFVDGQPLRLFHFSAFDPARSLELRPDEFDHPSLDPKRSPALRQLLSDYTDELIEAGWQPRVSAPVTRTVDGLELSAPVRAAIGAALMEAEKHGAGPRSVDMDPRRLTAWLQAPVTTAGLSWFLLGLHRTNAAVRANFPQVPGADEPRYLQWAYTAGVAGGIVPPRLVPTAIRSAVDGATSVVATGPASDASRPAPASAVADAALPAPVAGSPSGGSIEPSDELVRFTAEFRNERQSILEFAIRAAQEIPAGSRLLDVGAGNSPYRELFAHLTYESNDWQHSMHPGARSVDHVGPAHAIPVGDAEYDAVLCTQVLEHVANPQDVLNELHRLLKPGGRLYMTVPLAWELHELPFDFFRYTPPGLAAMLGKAGFEDLDIRARNDSFATIAQLLRNLPAMVGRYPDGKDPVRAQAATAMRQTAQSLDNLSGLDSRWIFPLGYSIRATKPGGPEPASTRERSQDRAGAGLERARSFVTLCFASDLIADPRLLTAYAAEFSATDDATLVVYAPDVDVHLASETLVRLVENLDLAGPDSPDVIALPYTRRANEAVLAASVDAVLALRPPWGSFAGLPWAHLGTLAELHERAAAAS
jgi:SAM-dependent methyltransferase